MWTCASSGPVEQVTLTDARIEGDMEVVLEIAPDRRRIVDP